MEAALGTSRRRPRASLTWRRNAEGRAVRERTRNSRIALACFIVLGTAITFGVRTTWAPAPIKITSMKLPTDADSLRFAENHTGRLSFHSLDSAICREMQFNNDTGWFSNERSMRCDEFEAKQQYIADAPQTDARARAFSIRGGFVGR